MKRALFPLLVLLVATSAGSQTKTPVSGTVAFVDVNVIPMDRERVLRHQTVIVRDGAIVEIGDTRRIKIRKAFVLTALAIVLV